MGFSPPTNDDKLNVRNQRQCLIDGQNPNLWLENLDPDF